MVIGAGSAGFAADSRFGEGGVIDQHHGHGAGRSSRHVDRCGRQRRRSGDGPAVCPSRGFTDPQMAATGLTEEQARASGHEVQVTALPMDQVPQALAARDTMFPYLHGVEAIKLSCCAG